MHFSHDTTQEGTVDTRVCTVLVAKKEYALSILVVAVLNHVLNQAERLSNEFVLLERSLKWGH
jgi:hypothetical protein